MQDSCIRWAVCFFLALMMGLAFGGQLSAEPRVRASALTFEKDIRPILKANCFDFHGEGETKSGLDLRLKRLMVAGGKSGPAIVPGKPGKSHLMELIRSGDMPKREKKLAAKEIAIIEKWIDAGAKTARPEPAEVPHGMTITEEERQHWAFQPIRSPEVPKVKTRDRSRTPIDAFLLAPLKAKGLSFSPDAEKVTLLRRASLDLTGLPPSPEEVARFVADNSPDAYEHEIDRLLASPHYGERWARHWLDAAGYADSDGATTEDTPRAHASPIHVVGPELDRLSDGVVSTLCRPTAVSQTLLLEEIQRALTARIGKVTRLGHHFQTEQNVVVPVQRIVQLRELSLHDLAIRLSLE